MQKGESGGKYGANTRQVEHFIKELRRLTAHEWHQIAVRASIDARWRAEDAQRAAASYAEAHLDQSQPVGRDITRVVHNAIRRAGLQESEAGFILLACNTAGLALLSRHHISGEHFAALYRPFAELITDTGREQSPEN